MKHTILAVLLLLLAASCTPSYQQRMEETDASFYSGQYRKAAESLLPFINKKDNSQLLYMMEAGLMLHTAEDYEASNRVLLKAAELAKTLPISFTKQAESLLLNERSTNYRGEDFERVLIHMYTGLNYLLLENFDSARVEFQRISYLLRDIKNEGGPSFNQNIMAKYLTAICYEELYKTDSDEQALEYAYTEYKQVYQLNPKLALVKYDLLRTAKMLGDREDLSLWQEKFGKLKTADTENMGELVVIHQAGRGAFKKSRGSLLQDSGMKAAIIVTVNGMTLEQGVTIAAVLIALNNIEHPIPDYVSAKNRVQHLSVKAADGTLLGTTSVLENLETTAFLSAKERYNRTKAQVAAGIAIKAAATVASAIAAEKVAEQTSLKDGAKVIGFLTGAAVGTTLASQIKPDLRCWSTLPSNLQLSRTAMEPGTYTITTALVDAQGTEYKKESRQIVIKAGQKTIVNVRSLR